MQYCSSYPKVYCDWLTECEGLKGVQTNNSVHIRYQRGVVGGSADLALKSSRIVDFGDKSSGFADLKNTVDRGSAESFGPVSGFCQSRSSDCGLDHQFSVGLSQCAGVYSANVPLPRFPEETFS